MTTTGNTTLNSSMDQRFERLNAAILENIMKIEKEGGKGPFELTIFSRGEEIIFNTNVNCHEGDWRWTRNGLREKLANVDAVRLVFESQDDSRTYEFPVDLDKDMTSNAIPGEHHETRKPQVAGASAN